MVHGQHWRTRTMVLGLHIDNDGTQTTLVHTHNSVRPTQDNDGTQTTLVHTREIVVSQHTDNDSTQATLVLAQQPIYTACLLVWASCKVLQTFVILLIYDIFFSRFHK